MTKTIRNGTGKSALYIAKQYSLIISLTKKLIRYTIKTALDNSFMSLLLSLIFTNKLNNTTDCNMIINELSRHNSIFPVL